MGGFLPGVFFFPLWEADAVEKDDGRGAVGETEESAAAAGSLLGVNDAAGFEILRQYKVHGPLQRPLKSPATSGTGRKFTLPGKSFFAAILPRTQTAKLKAVLLVG